MFLAQGNAGRAGGTADPGAARAARGGPLVVLLLLQAARLVPVGAVAAGADPGQDGVPGRPGVAAAQALQDRDRDLGAS